MRNRCKYSVLILLTLLELSSCQVGFSAYKSSSVSASAVSSSSAALSSETASVSSQSSFASSSSASSSSDSSAASSAFVSSSQSLASSASSLDFTVDPYVNVSASDFYNNYKEASCYKDAYYRSLHYLMSGSLQDQVQIPSYLRNTTNAYYPSGTGADNPNGQPKDSEKFIRNSSTYYSQDKLSYSIPDKSGNTVKTIYKGGAYITLEDVAAYVYAFGDVPANYDADKSASPSSSPWGKYLRVNNTYFSGRTANSFPYEPNFPDNSSDAGYTVRSAWTQAHEKEYYEIDIGTTGTFEYGGSYRAAVYNNGYKITRGASRIIYTRYLSSGNEISDPNERFVFYTYDHYNDFQEYLNYSEGWGAWFGNLAGGGVQNNSTYVYAQKAPYPEVSRNDL